MARRAKRRPSIACATSSGISRARVARVSGSGRYGRTENSATSVDFISGSANTAGTTPVAVATGPRSGSGAGPAGLRIPPNALPIRASIAAGSTSPTTKKVIRAGV